MLKSLCHESTCAFHLRMYCKYNVMICVQLACNHKGVCQTLTSFGTYCFCSAEMHRPKVPGYVGKAGSLLHAHW